MHNILIMSPPSFISVVTTTTAKSRHLDNEVSQATCKHSSLSKSAKIGFICFKLFGKAHKHHKYLILYQLAGQLYASAESTWQ